ncbi:hypothetical protein BDN72DRAFT_894641 [Pluteus cervinus]|uniref:Uncharacterized protein n=1 Tax=Pluteus cervinus TaxID=181527 RepID=A0ACD3B449_9AGAR|nr:hypothetical protein BDN72DRAFT_894641 [Pluteus cervinus]
MSSFPVGNVNLDTTFGALLVSALLSTTLWGVTCIQTYIYFSQKSRDRPIYKAIVALLFALDILDSALVAHFSYYYMVTHSANPLISLVPNWSCNVRSSVSFLSEFIIRMMFTIRVYKFSKKNLILIIWIISFSLIPMGITIFSTTDGFITHFFGKLWTSSAGSMIFIGSTVADLSIAISLCYLLHRSRTGFRRTDSLIRVLMMYTVNTGAIVALSGSIHIAIFVAIRPNLLHFIPYLILGKLHLNSYLASLNARETIREKFQNQDPILVESQFSPAMLGRARAGSIESGETRSGLGSTVPIPLSFSVASPSHRRNSL